MRLLYVDAQFSRGQAWRDAWEAGQLEGDWLLCDDVTAVWQALARDDSYRCILWRSEEPLSAEQLEPVRALLNLPIPLLVWGTTTQQSRTQLQAAGVSQVLAAKAEFVDVQLAVLCAAHQRVPVLTASPQSPELAVGAEWSEPERSRQRVLHFDPDVRWRDQLQQACTQDAVAIDHHAQLASAREAAPADLIVTELTLADARGVEVLEELEACFPESPLVLLTEENDAATLAACARRGPSRILVKSRLGPGDLETIFLPPPQRSVARASASSDALAPENAEVTVTPMVERRASPRYELALPIYVIPVRADGAPDPERQSEGITVDISAGGVGFQLPHEAALHGRLMIGIESPQGPVRFAAVEVRHQSSADVGCRYGASWLEPERDPLAAEHLRPRIDDAFQLGFPVPRALLEAWEQAGVLRRTLVGRGVVCPDCQGIPLVRNGCQACGSARLTTSRLIHHFACAHVDHATAFQRREDLFCPKCRAGSLIVGTDFEYLTGPYECLDCGWSDTEFETVGHCLGCDLWFPLHQASEEDFIGFHLERLDPMALVHTP